MEDLCYYFHYPMDDSIELIRDGKETPVTLDNIQEYIDLVLHAVFHETINLQV